MAPVAKRGRKRRRKKNVKSAQTPFLMQSLGAIILIILVIFLKTADIIPNTIAIGICMIVLVAMFYVMFLGQPKPKKRKRKRRIKKSESMQSEPQFYTALPSTLGLTDTSESLSKPSMSLPPRPITPVKRQRNFITYPLVLGGGDYSDSYVQVDKETVLRLRTAMTPDSQSLKLPGARISSFEDALVQSEEIAPAAASVVAEAAAPVVAEAAASVVAEAAAPVVAEAAAPVVAEAAAPVVAEVAPLKQKDEEEEEMEFDMEWD